MKKAYAISIFCTLLFPFMAGSALGQVTTGCDRGVTEAGRLQTARDLLEVDASNYALRVNYWAEDVVYREPVFTNHGRQEMFDYLAAMFGGTAYGFPDDKVVTIKDEVYHTDVDDSMTYIATMEWSGHLGTEFFIQTGMSIVKFDPGEGCPSYHRDYWSEGDTWWNIPEIKPDIDTFRGIYISIMGLTGRCFDDDFDGYTKYLAATGCPSAGLDCNDFVPEINPGATEIPENGIDDDCNSLTPDVPGSCAPASVVNAEYKEPSDISIYVLLLGFPFGAVVLLRVLRRRK
jgi:hypothetical protein